MNSMKKYLHQQRYKEDYVKAQHYNEFIKDIKSPLVLQSFIQTDDDSYQYQQKSKLKAENTNQILNSSISHSTPIQKSIILPTLRIQQNNSPLNEILSSINQSKLSQKNNNFCGFSFDGDQQKKYQVQFDKNTVIYQRKKIFKEEKPKQIKIDRSSPNETINITKQIFKEQIQLSRALQILYEIQEYELMNFLIFLNSIIKQLNKIEPYAQFLINNIFCVYHILASSSNAKLTNNYQRIFRRLKVNNFTQFFTKITKSSNPKIDQSIEQKMIQIIDLLQYAEKIVEDYITKPNRVNEIQRIYEVLQQNNLQSLIYQIKFLLNSFKVFEMDPHLKLLQYIWPNLLEPVSKVEFVGNLTRNDFIIRQSKSNEEILREQGFERNG